MAIDGVTGIPGSGKSHGVVQRILIPALKAGRHVVHNMPLNEDKLLALAGAGSLEKLPADVTREQIVATFPKGAVLVLDEAWRYWPAGLKAHAIPETEREFFAMHRHMVGSDGRSTDIVIVCQDLSQIAQFIRDLVEQTFRYTKQTAIGSRTRFRCDVYQGCVTGSKPPAARRTSEHHGKYLPEIYACYQSHTLSTTGVAGLEEKIDKRGTIWSRWTVWAAAAGLILGPVFAYGAYSKFSGMAPKGKTATTPAAEHREAAVGGPVAAALTVQAPPPPTYSQTWRFAGRITRHGRVVYIIQSAGGARYLGKTECYEDGASNYRCVIEGEIITEWTGPQPGFIQRAIGDAAQTDKPT